MNVLLFGGFLGSGKTSLILALAQYILQEKGLDSRTKQSSAEKLFLVIIENEVGTTGIDDKILKAEGLDVRELFSGCICCTLSAELTATLAEIQATFAPEWVIIESTGMAYPDKIAETLTAYGKRIDNLRIISVADAERWEELRTVVPDLVHGQLAQADFILVNKIDCVESQLVNDILSRVQALNSSASLYPVSAQNGVAADIWRKMVCTE